MLGKDILMHTQLTTQHNFLNLTSMVQLVILSSSPPVQIEQNSAWTK